MTPFNLREKITVELTESHSELWFPHLSHDLVQTGWQRLREEIELDEIDYGTARVILNDADAPRDLIYTLLFKDSEGEVKDTIYVEKLPQNIANHYKASSVNFYGLELITSQSVDRNEILDCLAQAFDIIRLVPSLFRTVIDLVKCIHLIRPESDDYDISFSEPHIPFSIFISVPQENNLINTLRVAEAIIHEAMHLQLTIIDYLIPLTFDSKSKYFSPWKNEYRNSQGVLHGVYVFAVISKFIEFLIGSNISGKEESNYIKDRLVTIQNEIKKVNLFYKCPDLTINGKRLVNSLLLSK